MKLIRAILSVIVVASVIASASAQVTIRRGHSNSNVANTVVSQALSALQQDLIAAIGSMKSALPIYDGNRVRSIRAAHTALVIVDHAIYGSKAAARENPNVSDKVSSGQAKTKYSAELIAASQTNMRQGLTSLQSAWKDLQTAVGSTPNKQGVMVSNHLQKAINEATIAITLHAPKA